MGKTDEKNNPFGLTDKQLAFCNYYLGLIDGSEKETMFNGRKSAIKAGYSVKSAKFIASENLTKPNLQRHLKYLRSKIVKFKLRSPESLKSELENIAVANVTELLDVKSIFVKVGETKDEKPIYDLQQRIILKDSKDWGDLSSAVSEISETKNGIRIKLQNKTAAIETLMRLNDMFPKRTIKLPGPKDKPEEGTTGSGVNYVFFLPEEGVELIPPDESPKEIKKEKSTNAADLIAASIKNKKKKG